MINKYKLGERILLEKSGKGHPTWTGLINGYIGCNGEIVGLDADDTIYVRFDDGCKFWLPIDCISVVVENENRASGSDGRRSYDSFECKSLIVGLPCEGGTESREFDLLGRRRND